MTRIQIASILLFLADIGVLGFGLVYTFTPRIMPFHEKFLNTKFRDLEPHVGALYLNFMEIAGLCMLAIGIALIPIVLGPYQRGDSWMAWLLYWLLLFPLISIAGIMYKTGKFTPWWLVLFFALLVIAAAIVAGIGLPSQL